MREKIQAALRDKTVKKRASFHGFSIKKEGAGLCAADNVNCDCLDGRLQRGVGIIPYVDETGQAVIATMGSAVRGIYAVRIDVGEEYSGEQIFFGCNDGYLYAYDPFAKKGEKLFSLGEVLSCHSLKDESKKNYHVFTGRTKAAYTVDGETFTTIATGAFLAGQVCGERYFLVDRAGIVYYSAPYLPYELQGGANDGGELYLPAEAGGFTGMEGVEDILYLFGKRTVYRLRVTANTSDFYFERLEYGGGNICPCSMVSTGKGVIFLSESGAYFIQGDKVERVCAFLNIRPNYEYDCSVGRCEDLTLIEYTEQKGDEEPVKKRIAFQADEKNAFFTQVYGDLCGSEYCFLNGRGYRYVRNSPAANYNGAPYFLTESVDFGTQKQKTLKKLKANGRGMVEITVNNGDISHVYTCNLSEGGECAILDKGREFSFKFAPAKGSVLESFAVEYVYAPI